MIGANIERGILRAQHNHIRPSVFNIATWHNGGVQTPETILELLNKKGKNTLGYGRFITMTLVDIAARELGIPAPPLNIRYNTISNSRYDESGFFRVALGASRSQYK